jgi:S1-C subfamily serine protease
MKPEGFGPSDQSSFYAKEIPVLHFFTGNHTDYHRPSDDWDKINVPGMNRVADMVEQVVTEVAQAQNRPDYIKVKSSGMGPGDGSRPYFGSIPDFGTDKPGYALAGVGPGSPAEKAGLRGGDRIIKMAGKKIDNLEDFDAALKKLSAGETVEVVVARDDKELTLKVTLDKPR